MIAISPDTVRKIDEYARDVLNISVKLLMGRAGDAVAEAARRHLPLGGTALILCGGGNNGGDGYAAALALRRMGLSAFAADVLGKGQAGEEGKDLLKEYSENERERLLEIARNAPEEKRARLLKEADEKARPLTLAEAAAMPHALLIDAVLGTGGRLPLREELLPVAKLISGSTAYKIAIDLPLGTDAESGRADPAAVRVDETVMLGFPKHGLHSYPARAYCGRLTLDPIGLDVPAVREHFALTDRLMSKEDAAALLPRRAANTHKGSFGHLLLLAGSPRYRGAALLAASAALRMGAGLVTLASAEEVLSAAAVRDPEVICAALPAPEDTLVLTEKKTAILIGPGAGADEALLSRLRLLLSSEGAPLVIDADGLTVLASDAGRDLLREAKRKVILTPHPAEFARLLGKSTEEVQADRLLLARAFVREYPVTLVLKGAATVVSEGERFSINLTGGPSLAKGGSGDVLAGALASLLATGLSPYDAARLAVAVHGAAGDRLATEFSEHGVRPADLPDEMARILGEVAP